MADDPKDPDADLVATLRSRLKLAADTLSTTREFEQQDLKFAAGSSDNNWQWPASVSATRGATNGQPARPTLTVNKLPQHIKQVTNAQRQNRPAGKVIPANGLANVKVAEIYDGMIRHIESTSNADIVITTACDNQVTFGEGYWRILTDYESEDSFDQVIRLGRIRNSFSVYMDPLIQDPCGMDAEWCVITERVATAEYERKWPKAETISSLQSNSSNDPEYSAWLDGETIRIAEYFYFEHETGTLNLYPDGSTAIDGSPRDEAARLMFGKPARTRQVDRKKVCWVKSNGFSVLERGDWAGKYIPVIRVIGNEFEIDGELHISGIVRNAKDAQRMYNYWTSQEAEMLALAPKAPFVGYAGQFKGYEKQWKTANTVNHPYLEANPGATDESGRPLPLPQRQQPPQAQLGLIQAKMGAAEDLKGSTGQYNASLGMESNERSGKAINARKHEGDTGTYHYVDNLAWAVRFSTLQLVDLIPKIYDTARIARVMGVDQDVQMVELNPQQEEPVREVRDPMNPAVVIKKIYNLGVGTYDVVVTTGPSYETQRQEARESMSQILQGVPDLWKVAGDLFAKNMDWPGATEFAARLRKTIDPKLLEDGDESPELQAAQQQIEQMGQQMEQMHQMLQNVSKSMEAKELDIKEFEASIKAFDAETKRLTAAVDSLNPDQVQEIVMGTLHGMISSGDLHRQMAELAAADAAPAMAPPTGGMPA